MIDLCRKIRYYLHGFPVLILEKKGGIGMRLHMDDRYFFEKNVVPHYPKLLKFLMYASQDMELARDLTQDTMETAWEHRKQVFAYTNIEAGLITIAKNKLKKHYRKNPVFIPIGELTDVPDPDKILEEIMIEIETAGELKVLFNELDEKYKRVLILHYNYKQTLKDISQIYGVSDSTVRSWHARALEYLKKVKKPCNENG